LRFTRAGAARSRSACVFGHDHKIGRDGRPVQQGLGSVGHENQSHFQALRKAEQRGQEPPGTYEKAVKEFFKRDRAKALAFGLIEPPRA
jgi:hypothetical protein